MSDRSYGLLAMMTPCTDTVTFRRETCQQRLCCTQRTDDTSQCITQFDIVRVSTIYGSYITRYRNNVNDRVVTYYDIITK